MEKLKTVNEVLNSLQLKNIDTLNVSQISLLDLIYGTCKSVEKLLSEHKSILNDTPIKILKLEMLNKDEILQDFNKEQRINQLQLHYQKRDYSDDYVFIIKYIYENDNNMPVAFFMYIIRTNDEKCAFNWDNDSWIEINADDSSRLRQEFVNSIFYKVNLTDTKK